MKVAFVRHPEMSGNVDAQVDKSAAALREKGFQGVITIYYSPTRRTKMVAEMIARKNGYQAPVVSTAIGLDDGEKSGAVFKKLCGEKGIAAALGHTAGGMLVLVTHAPVIRNATGVGCVDYAEVIVRDLP